MAELHVHVGLRDGDRVRYKGQGYYVRGEF